MAKWLLVGETNSNDPAREAEFREWYTQTHLPDVLAIPGFNTAALYENPEPAEGRGKFIAIYEIEGDDIEEMKKSLAEAGAKMWAEGRISELLEVPAKTCDYPNSQPFTH
jgi:hypothetical protein